ncbi:Crp/Fnr family transcriptional regulator [Motiliproteus sp. SC1-56]|uniref:Crp/Fnr family transcriptional regulator n=1 Tax=Motiliproteus sp. SC1-56 TaxID=2799565 RepID=UPI001A8D8D66|nr:Crp/Fnr family transcriptional regulator [Motiliproteus sp. SC1-56]
MSTSSPLLRQFPGLADITDEVGKALLAKAKALTVPAGATLFRLGDPCENYLLVAQGEIKVVGRSPSGREIVLYRIHSGGTCVLTTACLLGDSRYPAEGISETEVQAFALPRDLFQQGLEHSPALRRFVFDSYGQRLGALIGLVQEIAFDRIDLRLARHLLKQGRERVALQLTHQALATELGSAREVISRQLKELEHLGLVTLGRGTIRIDDLSGLQAFIERHQ